jgi:hypothetical protein
MTESPEIGTLPTNLDFEKSMMFFHAYVYGPLQGRLRIYGARRIPAGSVAMSSDWEVFASMLVNDLGRKLGAGIDLINYEVKATYSSTTPKTSKRWISGICTGRSFLSILISG